MPFAVRNLKTDPEDVGANFAGSLDLEFRLATNALELRQSGLCYQRIPPGYRFPYGHTHERAGGGLRRRARERPDEARRRDRGGGGSGTRCAFRPARGVATRPGPTAVWILVFGAPNLGDDPRGDVDGRREWWAD